MITKVTHLTIFVKDQNEALDFYVKKLGLDVHTDAMFGNMRWLTVCPKNQRDFEIVLSLPKTPEQTAALGRQTPQEPLFCVEADDCKKTVAELEKRGVKIINQPEEQPWGISAMVSDPYGNLIYIVSHAS